MQFAEIYEGSVLELDTLTPHQEQKLNEFNEGQESRIIEVSDIARRSLLI